MSTSRVRAARLSLSSWWSVCTLGLGTTLLGLVTILMQSEYSSAAERLVYTLAYFPLGLLLLGAALSWRQSRRAGLPLPTGSQMFLLWIGAWLLGSGVGIGVHVTRILTTTSAL